MTFQIFLVWSRLKHIDKVCVFRMKKGPHCHGVFNKCKWMDRTLCFPTDGENRDVTRSLKMNGNRILGIFGGRNVLHNVETGNRYVKTEGRFF